MMKTALEILVGFFCLLFLVANLRNASWWEYGLLGVIAIIFIVAHPLLNRIAELTRWSMLIGLAVCWLVFGFIGFGVAIGGGISEGLGLLGFGLLFMTPLVKHGVRF